MRRLSRLFIIVGLAAAVGGVAQFSYIIFIYPASDPPFRPLSGNVMRSDGAVQSVEVPVDGFCRLGVRFRASSDLFWNGILSAPHYSVRYDSRITDAGTGNVVFQESGKLDDAHAQKFDVDRAPEGGVVTTGSSENLAARGTAEQQLTAFPVRAGQKLTATIELPKIAIPDDVPLGAIETNDGSVEVREVIFLFGDYDPEARREFRAEGPMTGIQLVGGGIAALVVGWLIGRIAKPASPPI